MKGSIPWKRQVMVREKRVAAACPPTSLAAWRKFFRATWIFPCRMQSLIRDWPLRGLPEYLLELSR
jgi:hypothetical protein